MYTESLAIFRSAIRTVPDALLRISAETAETPRSEGKWSPKQELGHLLDSAANNHQRIVRAQLEDKPAMPGYEGDRWVALHHYQSRDWAELVDIWKSLNRQLLAAVEMAKDSGLDRVCTIGSSGPLTVGFIFDDYVEHMVHHLEHIGIRIGHTAGK